MAKTSLHTHTAVARLPGVSWAFLFYLQDVPTPEIKQNFVSFQHCLSVVLFLFQTSAHHEIILKQNTETVLGLFQPH